MDIEELTSAFMDHALTPEEEAELFHILSVSPEKRGIFRSFAALRSAVQEDLRATSVPADLDGKVLTGVAALAASAGSPVAGIAPWYRRYGLPLLAAASAVILFGGGYLFHDLVNAGGAASLRGADTEAVAARIPDISGEARGSAAFLQGEKGGDVSGGSVRVVEREVPVPGFDAVPAEPRTMVRRDTVFVARVDTVHATPPRSTELPAGEFGGLPLAAPSAGFIESIDVSVTREHMQTYPYVDYAALETKRMRQMMMFEAAYRFNRNHAIGVAFGEKIFSQEYYRIAPDSLLIIQQQPVYTYGGGFYRFSLPIMDGFVPQVSLHAGGTMVGPVLGARLAVAVSPFAHTYILFGGGGSMLLYKLDENAFTSYTLGLFYGIQYQF